MKKILIIEDDQIVANVYRNKLAVEGYQVEIAPDGETGLKIMRTFKPDTIILDLMLPGMSGVDVIKEVRSEAEFSKMPIIVFSNTYLTNMIQEAWKAGANKCLSKSNCSPKEVIEVVRNTIGDSGAMPTAGPAVLGTHAPAKTIVLHSETDAAFQADLRKSFIDSLPATLVTLRTSLAKPRQGRQRNDPAQANLRTLPPRPRPQRQRRHRRTRPDRAHVRRT